MPKKGSLAAAVVFSYTAIFLLKQCSKTMHWQSEGRASNGYY